MKRIGIILSFVVMFSGVLNSQVINENSSLVSFEVLNMKTKTVSGTFGGMKGEINFSADHLSDASFDVCIDAATVNTDNEKRDDHLRNEDFFGVDTYPTICFKSESVSRGNDGFQVMGQLSMHGVVKDVIIPFTFVNSQFVGLLEVSRLDYKVGEGTNTFMVGEKIKLQIICDID